MSNKRIRVALAILLQDNQVLVAKRRPEQHQGGLWEFPGGKVEEGESMASAALRELQEEMGVQGEAPQCIWQHQHDYGDRCVELQAFVIRHWQGRPQQQQGNPQRWVPLAELMTLAMPAANQPLNEQLVALASD